MAIQGKLVPQDPHDEPASVLLERIREEKKRLVKEGKIKADKNESIIYRDDDCSYFEKANKKVFCIDEEIPFELPNNWRWERWGNISLSIQYGYNAPAEPSGDIKMVRISDIQDNKVIWSTVPYCNIPLEDIDTYLLQPNDILFARTGGTVGKSFLVNEVPEPSIYAGYLIRTRYSNSLNPRYMKYFMESELYWSQLRSGTIATAQPNCNGKTLSRMFIPVPPQEEQRRIVAKLEELMPLIDSYGKSQEALNELNASLPKKLRQSILQEAIQGRLVPQDPNEETASVLLERIRAEKARLVKEKKIKADKNESRIFLGDDGSWYEQVGNNSPVCINDSLPFDLPEGWVWVRLINIAILLGGYAFKSHEYSDKGSRVIRISDITPFGIIDKNIVRHPYSESLSQFVIQKDDILMAMTGGTVGKSLLVDNLPEELMLLNQRVANIRPLIVNVLYIHYILSSNFIQSVISHSKNSTNDNISMADIGNFFIPLPPLAEQHRIVAKLEEILPKLKGM